MEPIFSDILLDFIGNQESLTVQPLKQNHDLFSYLRSAYPRKLNRCSLLSLASYTCLRYLEFSLPALNFVQFCLMNQMNLKVSAE